MTTPPVRRLIAQRLALGSIALVAPHTAGRLFGLDFVRHSQASVLTRLFAVRHVALGAGLLLTSGDAQRALVRMNLAVDAIDLVSVAVETRARSLPRTASVVGGVTALTATALGAAAVRDGW